MKLRTNVMEFTGVLITRLEVVDSLPDNVQFGNCNLTIH
jgi:hypothetical protein